MLKNFLLKKAMERQLKSLPQDQQAMIMRAVEAHPELFENIAKEIQAEIKGGSNQMVATMKVMKKHQAELQKAMIG